jgi:general secretion pathway protein F
MPVFAYKGLDKRGKEVKGKLDAESHRELRAALKRQGVFVVEYRESDERGHGAGRVRKAGAKKKGDGEEGGFLSREVDIKATFTRVKLNEVAEITRHLATLARAGIPIVDGMAAVIEQIENDRLKSVISDVRQSVTEGASLADALNQHPKVFSRLYVNMVKAGESSGTLDVVFNRLAEFIESQVRLRGKVAAAMTYPAVMAIVGTAIIMLLMVAVIPKFEDMFAQMGVELPLPTRVLIGISSFMQSWWWAVIALLGMMVWWFRHWKASATGRPRWDRFTLDAPIFGRLLREISLARFCRTLGTLLTSGVPLLTSMEIVKAILDNAILEAVVDKAREEVSEGQSLAAPLKQSGHFPPLVTQMIAMGEKSGQLEEMLLNSADAYEVQVDSKVQMLTSVLEPIMILVMGGFVAALVVSILMPMLRMNQAFQSMQ